MEGGKWRKIVLECFLTRAYAPRGNFQTGMPASRLSRVG